VNPPFSFGIQVGSKMIYSNNVIAIIIIGTIGVATAQLPADMSYPVASTLYVPLIN
ncbi:unnamed protein product, partial [Rotaria socialis]